MVKEVQYKQYRQVIWWLLLSDCDCESLLMRVDQSNSLGEESVPVSRGLGAQ